MKTKWFKRTGWFYIPSSIPGILVAVGAIAFCVHVFLAIDHHAHSSSDTFYGVFPYFSCVFLLFTWVASKTSKEES